MTGAHLQRLLSNCILMRARAGPTVEGVTRERAKVSQLADQLVTLIERMACAMLAIATLSSQHDVLLRDVSGRRAYRERRAAVEDFGLSVSVDA
jgi:hypothetical protein